MVFGSIISKTGSDALQIVQLFAAWRRNVLSGTKNDAYVGTVSILARRRVLVSFKSYVGRISGSRATKGESHTNGRTGPTQESFGQVPDAEQMRFNPADLSQGVTRAERRPQHVLAGITFSTPPSGPRIASGANPMCALPRAAHLIHRVSGTCSTS